MRFHNGLWHYQGKTYATPRTALLAAKGTLPRGKLLDYTYTPEASRAAERVMNRLAELLGGISTAENEMSALLSDLEDAYERQGFTNGCRYGAQLARELQV